MKRGAWLRGHMLGLVLLLGGHAWAGEPMDAGVEESDGERAFREWVARQARPENLAVKALWRGDLDGDGEPERVALLCSPDPMDELLSWYVLEKGPDARWVLARGQNQLGTCGKGAPQVAAPPRWNALGAALELRDSYATWESVDHLALRDGWPALVSFWWESHSNFHESVERQEWDGLQGARWLAERKVLDRASRSVSTEFALLPVLAQEAPLPPTLNRIPVGRKHHAGEADASLRVSVLREGPDAIRVRLEVRDDLPRPVPEGASAARFLAADHLELWWRPDDDASCEETLKASCPLRQLGLALRESGGVEVRWLYPKKVKGPLPVAELREGRVEVVLPLSLLGYTATRLLDGWEVPFTAVFSDSDEDSGQQTLIATSDLQWGVPASFGSLVFTAGGRRHPAPAPRHGIESWRRLEGKARLREH